VYPFAGIIPILSLSKKFRRNTRLQAEAIVMQLPGGMKNDKRTKFMQWYEDEILKYCRSDVDIFHKSCLTFRKMFMDVTCKDELSVWKLHHNSLSL
jgi:hypothetical protein